MAVVLFHLKVDLFNGGYVGVDIFFVISGYLITRNIILSIENGRFSFAYFYSRRLRRLFPALFFTIFVSFLTSLFFMSPEDLRDFSRTVITTLAAISNVLFWRDSHEYFSRNTQYLPLLHTWSLSVEEQFYLIWPAVLVFLAKFKFRYRYQILFLGVGGASLAACEFWLPHDASAVFYLAPFRFFEFAIGALCISAESQRPASPVWREVTATFGFAAIIGSITLFTSRVPFPGLYALISCMGAAFVICAGPTARVSSLLTNRIAVGIGLISYSLYLCHWPVIVFTRLAFGEITSPVTKLILVALMFAVATGMYFFVEMPFRRPRLSFTYANSVKFAASCVALSVCLATVATVSLRQNGWHWRLNSEQHALWEKQRYGSAPCVMDDRTECAFGVLHAPLGMQIIGDSHMEDIVAGFHLQANAMNRRGEAFGAGGCPMLSGLTQVLPNGKINTDCRDRRNRFVALTKDQTAPLIISQSWKVGAESVANDRGIRFSPATAKDYMEVWRAALIRTISELGKTGRHFLIIGDQVGFPCQVDRRAVKISPITHGFVAFCPPTLASTVHTANVDVNEMLREVQREFPQEVALLFPEEYLCDLYCVSTANGFLLYWDKSHYTVAGAEYLISRARDVVVPFLLSAR
jgi:peptidoglycan/LPS O-acetylase OafA/YrhL